MATGVNLRRNTHIFLGLFALVSVSFLLGPVEALQDRNPTPITLGDKQYVTQEYVVKKGDWISKILRRKGSLNGHDLRELPQLLEMMKKLNKSLDNLDLIRPGQKIVILIKAKPDSEDPADKTPPETKKPLPPLRKELKYENYTVTRGDWLSSIVVVRYNITLKAFFKEYLPLFKRTNPSLQNPDKIIPGQIIKLPLYPPQYVKRRVTQDLISQLVKASPPKKPPRVERPKASPVPVTQTKPATPKRQRAPGKGAPTPDVATRTDHGRPVKKVNTAVYHLGRIFTAMGEGWIQSGEHFIPLKAGSGVHFKATSFPMVNLRSARWVIVDPSNTFPEKLARLIGSTWTHYRVVHLKQEDDLRSAVGKVLKASGYPKVFKRGEPLELRGDIALKITGDWIVTLTEPGSGEKPSFIVINLIESHKPRTPETIKNYLAEVGVKAIEYPPVRAKALADTYQIEKTEAGPDRASLIEILLTLMGYSFSAQTEVHVYQDQEGDLRFVVTADYYLRVKGRNAIIDLTGMSQAVKSFLDDQGLRVLDLTTVDNPLDMVVDILKFCGVQFDPGPHSFKATAGDESKNIGITIPGVVFSDRHGKPVLATPLDLPNNIAAFLAQKGYTILTLPPSKSRFQVKATVVP